MASEDVYEARTRSMIEQLRNVVADGQQMIADGRQTVADAQGKIRVLEQASNIKKEHEHGAECLPNAGAECLPNVVEVSKRFSEGQSHKEILRWLGERDGNLIRVSEAVNIMKAANVFETPENAASIVYSVLNRGKEFTKIDQGLFRVVDQPLDDEKAEAEYVNEQLIKGGESGGVQAAVKNLNEGSPDMSKSDI